MVFRMCPQQETGISWIKLAQAVTILTYLRGLMWFSWEQKFEGVL